MRVKLQRVSQDGEARLLYNRAPVRLAIDPEWLDLVEDGEWVWAECEYRPGGFHVLETIGETTPPDWARDSYLAARRPAPMPPPTSTSLRRAESRRGPAISRATAQPIRVRPEAIDGEKLRLTFSATLRRRGRVLRGKPTLERLDGLAAEYDFAEVLLDNHALVSAIPTLRLGSAGLVVQIQLVASRSWTQDEANAVTQELVRAMDAGWLDNPVFELGEEDSVSCERLPLEAARSRA